MVHVVNVEVANMKKTIGFILALPTIGFIIGAVLFSIKTDPTQAVIAFSLYVSFTIGVILMTYET